MKKQIIILFMFLIPILGLAQINRENYVESENTFYSFPYTPSSEPTEDYHVVNLKYANDNYAILYDSIDSLRVDISGASVTEVTSATTNQLTVANGTTTPAISVVTGAVADAGTGLCTMNDIYDFVMANAGTGTVTEVTSATTNQLTVTNGTTVPELSVVIGAIANGNTNLVISDLIYDTTFALRTNVNSNITDISALYDTAAIHLDTLQALRTGVNNNYDSLVIHLDTLQALRVDINKNTDSITQHRTDINSNITDIADLYDTVAVHLDTLQQLRVDLNSIVLGSGTVTEVTSSTTNQLTVANGTTTPALSVVTGAIANASTDLVISDLIYDSIAALRSDISSISNLWLLSDDTLSPSTSGNNVQLESTTTSSNGVIFKGVVPFIHDFHDLNGSTAIPIGRNLFIGENAGNFTTGSTATSSTHSSNIIGIGYNSISNNTLGYNIVAVGNGSMDLNTTGLNCVALGGSSLGFNTTGNGNTGAGFTALGFITTTNGNSSLGEYSGAYYGSGLDHNTQSSYSLFLGYQTRPSANSETNQTVIGPSAIGNGSNTVTLGDDNVTDVHMGEDGQAATIQTVLKLLPTASPPSSPSLGWIYVDTDTHAYLYNGTSWVQLDN